MTMAAFAAEPIAHIGSFPIANTLIHTLLIDGILIASSVYIAQKRTKIPNMVQNAIEYTLETFYKLTESISQKQASHIFPFVMTFFLFILVANWTSLLPGFGSIGIVEHTQKGEKLVPILRGATSDINVTLALALVSVVATHFLSVRALGIGEYLGRFFSLNPINLFVGMLEIVSEITKIVSLSFRLFGNIFAGEVVLSTVSNIFAFLFPLPFLLLEFVVGIVQALVFSILTLVFMAILTTPHHAESKEVSH